MHSPVQWLGSTMCKKWDSSETQKEFQLNDFPDITSHVSMQTKSELKVPRFNHWTAAVNRFYSVPQCCALY